VIGLHGKLPWSHKGDLRRFRELTTGSTVVMGRKTFESLGEQPLAGRRNIVVSRRSWPSLECFPSVALVREAARDDPYVWYIGGKRVFAEALEFCDLVDMTYVPDRVEHPDAVYFPPMNLEDWQAGPRQVHDYNGVLEVQRFVRRA
jgi:dihydrofolate reductase